MAADKQVMVRVTSEQHRRLQDLATAQDRSISWLVRLAVRQFLDDKTGER